MTQLKQCNICKEYKPSTNEFFSKVKTKKDGLNGTCKECINKKAKERKIQKALDEGREYKALNPLKASKEGFKVCKCCKEEFPATNEYFNYTDKNKKYLHSKCKPCQKEYNKKYNNDTKEINNPKRKVYAQKHREKMRETSKKHQKENLQMYYANNHKYRHGRRDSGKYTQEQIIECLEFFDYKCAYTGECIKDEYDLDHIKPISKGGNNYIWNLVPSLPSINRSKNNKDLEEWYSQQDFFSQDRLDNIYDYIFYMQEKYIINEIDDTFDELYQY